MPGTPRPVRGPSHLHTVRSRADVLAVIATGGALGSLGRWWLGTVLSPGAGGFPWATFVVNVTGGFLVGVLMVLVVDVWPTSRYVRPFLGVGLLGGWTTFSTYALDTRGLLADDRPGTAAVYLLATLVVGLAAVWAGAGAARGLVLAAGRRGRARRSRRASGGADRSRRQTADPTERRG